MQKTKFMECGHHLDMLKKSGNFSDRICFSGVNFNSSFNVSCENLVNKTAIIEMVV